MAPKGGDARELAEPAGHDRVGEQTHSERGEDVHELRLVLGRQGLPDGQPPGEGPEQRRDDVEEIGEHDPAPDHELERVEHASPLGPAPPEQRRGEDEGDDGDCRLRPSAPPDPSGGSHAALACARSSLVTPS